MASFMLRTRSPRLEWLETRAVPAVVGAASSEPEVTVNYADGSTTTQQPGSSPADPGTDPAAIGVLPINPIAPPVDPDPLPAPDGVPPLVTPL
ncbi:MAG: hypothetical protein ACRC33_27230, partial [Gemmataceae bacterium]